MICKAQSPKNGQRKYIKNMLAPLLRETYRFQLCIRIENKVSKSEIRKRITQKQNIKYQSGKTGENLGSNDKESKL